MSFKDKILNNQSPWGSPPGGGGQSGNGSGARREPPNLDDLIKNFQNDKQIFRRKIWRFKTFYNRFFNFICIVYC